MWLCLSTAVCHWLLSAMARIRAQVKPCRIYGRQCGTETGFSWVLPFPLSLPFYRWFISSGGRIMGPLAAQFHRHAVTPSQEQAGLITCGMEITRGASWLYTYFVTVLSSPYWTSLLNSSIAALCSVGFIFGFQHISTSAVWTKFVAFFSSPCMQTFG